MKLTEMYEWAGSKRYGTGSDFSNIHINICIYIYHTVQATTVITHRRAPRATHLRRAKDSQPLGQGLEYKRIQSWIPRRAGRLFFWSERYFINASDISGPIRLFFLCVGYFEKPKKNKIAETLKQPKHHSSLSWINLKCIIV